MHSKTNFFYLILFIVILCLITPAFSLAFEDDNIYVWSNFSSSVPTSIVPSEEEKIDESNRELFRYYFWKLHFNGPKNWTDSL